MYLIYNLIPLSVEDEKDLTHIRTEYTAW